MPYNDFIHTKKLQMLTGDALLAKVKELTIMEPTEPVSREQSIGRTQREMIDKEQQIRVKILPQLEKFSEELNYNYCSDDPALEYMVRKLDKITEELITILNQEDT